MHWLTFACPHIARRSIKLVQPLRSRSSRKIGPIFCNELAPKFWRHPNLSSPASHRDEEGAAWVLWLFELNLNGYKLMVRRIDDKARIYSRRGADSRRGFRAEGEERLTIASNLLELDGHDLRRRELIKRKSRFVRLLAKVRRHRVRRTHRGGCTDVPSCMQLVT